MCVCMGCERDALYIYKYNTAFRNPTPNHAAPQTQPANRNPTLLCPDHKHHFMTMT